LILQIQHPDDERPLQFPVVIRNLAAGVVTLELKNPWFNLNWKTLKGLGVCLRLLSAGTDEVTDIRGTVTWAKPALQGSSNLSLGLELATPTPATHKLLSGHIPHTSDDIKGLWDRWDEARQSSSAAAISTKIGYAAVALLAVGLVLQLAEPRTYKLFGWGLWFIGTLAVAGQTLQYWKNRKATR
jgi:hypothetical protein